MSDLSNFAIKVGGEPLIVGEKGAAENKVTVSISLAGSAGKQKILGLWLGASVGSTARDLVAREHVQDIQTSVAGVDGLPTPTTTEDTLDVRKAETPGADSGPWTLILEKGAKGFWLKSGQTLEITLSGLSVVSEGKAVLNLYLLTGGQDVAGMEELEVAKQMPVQKPDEPTCEILQFDVAPRYISPGDLVKITWKVAGAREVKVTVPGASLLESAAERTKLRKGGSLDYTPPDTGETTFTLTATPPEKAKQEPPTRRITVYQTGLGWGEPVDYSATLGEPATLFADQATMYAIFLRGGRAALYRSADGLNAWFQVTDQIPPDMQTSPGVVLDNKLWLIGGSATSHSDPKAFSNAVWYYDTTGANTAKRWQQIERPEAAPWPTPRLGHACVVFKPKESKAYSIWLLGGYDENHIPLNDVWCFEPDSQHPQGSTWRRVLDNRDGENDWGRRLLLGAAADEERLYLFGGVVGPRSRGVPTSYSSANGSDWEPETKADLKTGFPLAAALVKGRTTLYRFTTRQDDTRHAERRNRASRDYSPIASGPGRWESYEKNPFSLAGVYFDGRFFLRTLADPTKRIGAERQIRKLHYLKPV